jgi:uncharacterized DUF497 family protein
MIVSFWFASASELNVIRIFGVRPLTKTERKDYEENRYK